MTAISSQEGEGSPSSASSCIRDVVTESQYISSNCVLYIYYNDLESVIEEHFSKALKTPSSSPHSSSSSFVATGEASSSKSRGMYLSILSSIVFQAITPLKSWQRTSLFKNCPVIMRVLSSSYLLIKWSAKILIKLLFLWIFRSHPVSCSCIDDNKHFRTWTGSFGNFISIFSAHSFPSPKLYSSSSSSTFFGICIRTHVPSITSSPSLCYQRIHWNFSSCMSFSSPFISNVFLFSCLLSIWSPIYSVSFFGWNGRHSSSYGSLVWVSFKDKGISFARDRYLSINCCIKFSFESIR